MTMAPLAPQKKKSAHSGLLLCENVYSYHKFDAFLNVRKINLRFGFGLWIRNDGGLV